MIDVLLVNPPSVVHEKRFISQILSMPPLGLMYIGTYLKLAGFKVELIDFTVEHFNSDSFKRFIQKKKPKIIGISTYTVAYRSVKLLVELIKSLLPETKIVAGGAGATFSYNKYLNDISVDFIIKGEGELAFKKLAEVLINNESNISIVKGVVYLDKKRNIIHTNCGERIRDLDSLYWPDRELIDLSKYVYPFTICTTRGCPGTCIFCSSKQFWGKKIYLRTAKNIFGEVDYLMKRYNPKKKSIFIVDDTFTMVPNRTKEFAKLFIDSKYKIEWGCDSRADVVDKNLLLTLYESGCRVIQFGLESGNNEVLRKIGKRITWEQVETAINLANSIGFNINVSFIIGHPFDTHKTIRQTLELVLSLYNNYGVNPLCAIYTPYPGTIVYENPNSFGLNILTDSFENYTTDNPIIMSNNFTPNDLRRYFQSFQDVIMKRTEKLFYQ